MPGAPRDCETDLTGRDNQQTIMNSEQLSSFGGAVSDGGCGRCTEPVDNQSPENGSGTREEVKMRSKIKP
ncbi:hypothetical protein J6590_013233 [Homalodisca vitripennis]|nr:hypothetical protein J6590_013233 [Homalodisca vitripennis]